MSCLLFLIIGLQTLKNIVLPQHRPPIACEIASAQNTPFTPRDVRGSRIVSGTTRITFLNIEKKTAYRGCFRATNVFWPPLWKLIMK